MGIAASLLRLLIGHGGKDELLRGDAIRVDIDGSRRGEMRDYLLWMATTLDRFIMHLHRLLGRAGRGVALHGGAVSAAAAGAWRCGRS